MFLCNNCIDILNYRYWLLWYVRMLDFGVVFNWSDHKFHKIGAPPTEVLHPYIIPTPEVTLLWNVLVPNLHL